MVRPSLQDPSLATPEQVCMLGLYAVGASLLSTMHQTASPYPAPESFAPKHGLERKSMAVERPVPSKQLHAFPKKSAKQSQRKGKSLDLFSSAYAVPPPRQPSMHDFSFNASRLGIAGDALHAEMPPSPLSSRAELPSFQEAEESPRSKGWMHYLTPSWIKSHSDDDDDVADRVGRKELKKQLSRTRLSSVATSARREQRSASDPDTSLSTSYVPARLGPIPFLPREGDVVPQSRARSMSLDVPRLARKSMSALRTKKPPSATTRNEPAPRLAEAKFLQGRDYHDWNRIGLQVNQNEVSLQDLPRESTSSSESDYSYDRRHSISGSSGHEGLHARARGHSDGSYASTAPSTVTDTAVMSAFSVDSHESGSEEDQEPEDEDDDEDDIEWERPAFRPACVSPNAFEHMPSSPCANRGQGRSSFQVGGGERPRLPSFSSYSKSPSKDPSKVSFAASILRGPRRMTSASSLGAKSADSGRSSFSERARRSFSQARTMLTVPSPRSAAAAVGRRSTADDIMRPGTVFLQPINTGVISRPCQTTPNPVASSRSNSIAMTCSTTNTIDGSSVRYPSLYLGTSSESGSVTGGSSGNSSGGRSWESTAPELAALEELVLTECKYLADLQLLLDVYVEGLRRMGLMTPASLDKIVSNLDEVMAFSKFLIDTVRAYLPRRMSPPTSISSQPSNSDGSARNQPQQATSMPFLSEPDYLGLSTKLVKELPARMDVYARYCLAHHSAKERLAFERELRPAVATFIELTRSTNPTLQGMDMAQFLVLPVQRVTRYPLLFGCLAKECGKRRTEGDELREEDEDAEVAHQSELRQERAEAIHGNWIRLRDVSSSICGLTNLAISYQQQPPRSETLRSRPRPSVSSPMLSSSNSAPFGSMHSATPPPPALVARDESSALKPAPAISERDAKPRPSTFPRSPWRKSSAKTSDKTSDKRQIESAGLPSASSRTASGATPSASSNGSSSSLLTRFMNALKHPST